MQSRCNVCPPVRPRRAMSALLLLVPALLLAVSACAPGSSTSEEAREPGPGDTDEEDTAAAVEREDEEESREEEEEVSQTDDDTGRADEDAEAPSTPDPAEVGANELGLVPVLMYHRLLDDGGGDYDLTPEQFRDELERLYEEDYRPVRLKDAVRGHIDVPAGTTPVVLTFDDSTREQAALDNGRIADDTAIGILLEFAEQHEGFEPRASLYVNAGPFGGGHDSDDIVRLLYDLGFELGNHTAGHHRLDRLSPDDVRRELAQGKEVVTDVVPEAEVVTMALPLGIWPDPRDLAYQGEWEGTSYAHEGILLVGAEPAPSPFHADFDPMAIPRIRSGPWDGGEPDYASGYWLDWLQDNPDRRYVSDGDPSRISFPEEYADDLAPGFEDRANPY